jgi:rubrerythrin
MSLKGSKTEENLKAAFAGESQANRRYLYFAQKADIEGYNDVATVFRSTAAWVLFIFKNFGSSFYRIT